MGPVCLACGSWFGVSVCAGCVATLRAAPETWVPPGLVVRPAYLHEGAARRMVHRLKYHGLAAAAAVLAEAMAGRLPTAAGCLVPVPRAMVRRWRHGVDPARELATALGRSTGLPVLTALTAPLWWPAHARQHREGRAAPAFRMAADPERAVLIDDVVTTGATLAAAASVLGSVAGAVTATAASQRTKVPDTLARRSI